MRTIDLSGPDGNAYALVSYARRYARQLKLDGDAIIKDMMSGDYDHLLQVFEMHFGMVVRLQR
jgi:hypothetical protein